MIPDHHRNPALKRTALGLVALLATIGVGARVTHVSDPIRTEPTEVPGIVP